MAQSHKGGRPVKTEGRKDFSVRFRISKDELDNLIAMENALGLNRSQLIRIMVLEGSTRQLINAKAVLDQLNLVGSELGKSGNNINQLARHANTLKLREQLSEQVMTEFILLFREYIRIRGDTEKAMRSIIRLLRP